MKFKTLKISALDNIEVALVDLPVGELIKGKDGSYPLVSPVAAKHKFATESIVCGGDVIMYGVLIGKALMDIRRGEVITTSNIKHASSSYGLHARKTEWSKPDVSRWKNRTFNGFHRSDGTVGVNNYWLVIPLVFCENKNVLVLQDAFNRELGYQKVTTPYQSQLDQLIKVYKNGRSVEEIAGMELDQAVAVEEDSKNIFPNVDGIKFLTHTLGCGGTKEDALALCGLLAGYITHSNVAGATVLSLGCQGSQIECLNQEIQKRDPNFDKPLYLFEQQKIGSESKLLRMAIKQTFVGLMTANELVRQPAPLSKLCLGLECGGSDGFSGISANPAVGYASDLLVALGGSVILSEFPELCGVEQELSDRCANEAIATKFMNLMTTYRRRAIDVGSDFDANPSPGNIRNGLITDAMKSAGAAKKGGTSPVTGVLDYPEKATEAGLSLLCTPGSDIESTTAEVGAGATIVLFTTGLGTPTGNPIAPVVKISTNTPLYEKMRDIIDLDCGTIITGTESIQSAGERILEYVIQVANGETTVSAVDGMHDDFIPWKRGISL